MDHEQLAVRLQNVEDQIKKLLSEYRALKNENIDLKNENDRLQTIVKLKEREIDDFQNKINISTIVSNVGVGNADTSELKALIDDYINEIDRCVIHLSR